MKKTNFFKMGENICTTKQDYKELLQTNQKKTTK
jgi:hypothetical protein